MRGWLMRGTVHLVASDDYGWMRPLFADAIARESRRRLAQLGMPAASQDRALRVIERALGSDGVVSRRDLVERLARGGVPLTPQTRLHVVCLAVVEGIACLGPDERGSASLALAGGWLGRGEERGRGSASARVPAAARGGASARGKSFDRDRALAELARRYLGAFGPASDRDFAKWSGLPLRDCRRGLERIAPELVEIPRLAGNAGDAGESGQAPRGSRLLALRAKKLRAPRSPMVRLLPAFDTYLMGYASRDHAVGAEHERRLLPGGGVLRPAICVDGRFAGLWSSRRSGDRLMVSIEPFEPFGDDVLAAIGDEVADIGRFEGLTATLGPP